MHPLYVSGRKRGRVHEKVEMSEDGTIKLEKRIFLGLRENCVIQLNWTYNGIYPSAEVLL